MADGRRPYDVIVDHAGFVPIQPLVDVIAQWLSFLLLTVALSTPKNIPFICIYIYMYMYTYVYIYIYMYMYTYVYIYIYTKYMYNHVYIYNIIHVLIQIVRPIRLRISGYTD